jgi:hypothetical protein
MRNFREPHHSRKLVTSVNKGRDSRLTSPPLASGLPPSKGSVETPTGVGNRGDQHGFLLAMLSIAIIYYHSSPILHSSLTLHVGAES